MKMHAVMAGLLALLLSAPPAHARDQSAPARSAAHANLDQQMRRQRDNMIDMRHQLEELRATSDPARRRHLLQAHLQRMRDTVELMRSMAELSMRGRGEDGGRPSGGYGSTPDPEEQHRYAMLKERLDMLQEMMEQIVQRERIVGECPAP